MRLKSSLIAVAVMVGTAALMFYSFQHQLTGASLAFGSHPEVVTALESSLDDLKRLAELDPDNEAMYRARFDELAATDRRLQVLEHTRGDLIRRYEILLLVVFSLSVIAVTGIYAFRQTRHEPRLAKLQEALAALAEGSTEVAIGDGGRDTIGRIAQMVERASRLMARDRQRLQAMKNLSSWQEAARRHAHELRTPLTGAQLELTRLQDLLAEQTGDSVGDLRQAAVGVEQEIHRLTRFTDQFHTFARLPRPRLVMQDLRDLLEDVVSTYAAAWNNLDLVVEPGPSPEAEVDRDLLRQVVVNLCDNSSQALAEDRGTVTFVVTQRSSEIHLDVSDGGPGIDSEIGDRLFEPYTTTQELGEGVGLGLAISKKILLDHGGDLDLLGTSSQGTTFRISLPYGDVKGGRT
jgi:two-component system nitrogen regulation sensor histidine kinase NtrY